MWRIFVINPGSTSTKVASYEDHLPLWQENIEHSADSLKNYPTIYDQLEMRIALVNEVLRNHGETPEQYDCIMARGGLLPPLESGAYRINPDMLYVLKYKPVNQHASNLGAEIAYRIAQPVGIPAYIYDPVTVDEMIDLVRITGLKEVRRHGQGHNLNMRAVALRYCRENGLAYHQQTLIVAHLGGGITLSLHHNGRIIDMISDDEGPFSPERAGLIPTYKLLKLVRGKSFDYDREMKRLQHQGGLMSHFGVSDAREVEHLAKDGNAEAELVYAAMALSVSRAVASLSTVVCGNVDRILLTGGLAFSEKFTGMITDRTGFIAPVTVLPGENEMLALAEGACRVLSGEEAPKTYSSI